MFVVAGAGVGAEEAGSTLVGVFEVSEVLVVGRSALDMGVDFLEAALDHSHDDHDHDEHEGDDPEDQAEEEDAAALALHDAVDSSRGEHHQDQASNEPGEEHGRVDLRVLEESVALRHDAPNERQKTHDRAHHSQGRLFICFIRPALESLSVVLSRTNYQRLVQQRSLDE